MRSTPVGNRFPLVGEQRRAYERDGFVVLRDVVPGDVLAGLRDVLTATVERMACQWLAQGRIQDTCDGSPFETRYAALCRQLRYPPPRVAWREVLRGQPKNGFWPLAELLERVSGIVGDDVDANETWDVWPLPPGNAIQEVGWHRDMPGDHGRVPLARTRASVWLPLVPVDERSGCLQFMPGSHDGEGHAGRARPVDRGGCPPPQESQRIRPFSAVMEPGDAVLFSDTVLRQELDNITGHVRWSVEIRLLDASHGSEK